MNQAQQPEALRLAQAADALTHVAPESGHNPFISKMAAMLRAQHARIAELKAERDQYAIWLAGCRDAFPAPEVNTTADELLMMAIADPGDVLAYVKHRAAPAAQAAEPAAVAVPDEDLQDLVSKALRRAWQLGQTYWQQADSEYASQHKKADETQDKFSALIEETRAALAATQAAQGIDWPAEFEKLQTPMGVQLAMLGGHIAKISLRDCAHAHGEEALCKLDAALAATQAQDVQRDADIQRAVLAERERICAAIKAEDDHCVTQGDYMLDSEDCIKVVRGEWVRPVYEIGSAASAAQGEA